MLLCNQSCYINLMILISFSTLTALTSLFFVLFGFLLMEVVSYIVHRWLFHGVLWKIHLSHHYPRKSYFETNDIFSLIFALIAIVMTFSSIPIVSAIGIGISVYGIAYFIIHDMFTHRRFFPFKSKNRFLLMLRSAHQRHHQSIEKAGLEPFGLFIFDYKNFRRVSRL